MKRFASPFLILICILCLSPLGADGGGTIGESIQTGEVSEEVPIEDVSSDAAPADGEAAKTAKNGNAAPSSVEQGKNSDAAASKKEAEKDDASDLTFASIHTKGLTVADGNKWYYENFDRQGRASFAVLYEDGTAIEKTVWTYQGSARSPVQKEILRNGKLEIFRYDEEGRELTAERYEGKTLTFKRENSYTEFGKLLEQTITEGKNTDRSVWEFVDDKAVAQTKYRNGKKTAFIELHDTPHIVHLYVDDKEVYVGEEQ